MRVWFRFPDIENRIIGESARPVVENNFLAVVDVAEWEWDRDR